MHEIVASACRLGLEGIVAKRRDSHYVSRRSSDWIKLKCGRRQEFVIGGYTDPKGSRTGFGSLLLGVHDASGALQYAGNVGTGFDERSLRDVAARLAAIPAAQRPFAERTGIDAQAHWVEPVLVAEVSFGEWTRTGRIRHSSFHGLRSDKQASEIVREQPAHPGDAAEDAAVKKTGGKSPKTAGAKSPAAKTAAAKTSKTAGKTASVKTAAAKAARAEKSIAKAAVGAPVAPTSTLPAGFRVSNPERVIDPQSGTMKIDLVRYYALVAPLMMPHLKGRPVSLVRAPAGIAGELFFQKHAEAVKLPGVRQLDPALFPGHPPLLEIATPRGCWRSRNGTSSNCIPSMPGPRRSRRRTAWSSTSTPARACAGKRCRKRPSWCSCC